MAENKTQKAKLYKEVSSDLDFVTREKKIKDFWNENGIFEKSIESRKDAPPYVFYDGPPTANGKPHIGHVLTRVIKDMIPRYHTMKGEMVPRKAGWDTHGLPVELEVEKMLGLDGKEQIEQYGLEPFISHCKESVWKYKEMWEDFSQTVGFWADMENPYVTYENDYIESEWWALKQIYEKGLLYKGFKIVPYCPRCGTPLSSHEVAQGYKDVKERSAIAKFKVKGENAYILAWTTTPWTLPSNVALCVHPDYDYIKVKAGEAENGEVYYISEALAPAVLKDEYTVLEKFKGRQLEYKEYEPLFEFAKPDKKCFFVTCDDYVTLTEGTGIVHTAPAFGEDDARVGKKYELPFVQLVDTKGEMTAETDWPGVFCKDADMKILEDLKKRGLLFAAPKFEHNYPFCWRCDTPLIYYAREAWFINMTAVKDDLIRNNNTINWIPENVGKGRFGDWLENVQDWGISRDRYWGTPLNIWECECGHRHSVGSVEELKSMSENCPEDIELHRPYIDEVTIKCPECGKQMKRVKEVIDCWFDSGAMPFAQHHYPFENKSLFEAQFPADFISEAVDQTRGWFYSLLAISTLIFNKAPFKNVIVLGHVQDENGQKMSKSKGNAVDPFEALQAYGADAIRWYFYTNSAPWLPNKFSGKIVTEGQRKFMGTLWNTYAFYILYANIDGFDPTGYSLEREQLSIMDKWLLSRLASTVSEVDGHLANYRIPEAAHALDSFVDELSNWYVRRGRSRYWSQELTKDKINAYMTLYTALVEITKAAAPMIPFMAEEMYQNLVRSVDKSAPISVHLCDFPRADETAIDKRLEESMELILKVVALGRAARNSSGIKNRQPLQTIYVHTEPELDGYAGEIITDELNVHEMKPAQSIAEYIDYTFKPQLKTLGPKFGKRLGEIKTALSELDGSAAAAQLGEKGFIALNTPSGAIELPAEDLIIESRQKSGFYTLSENGITVALDTELTDKLIEEGIVRELVSKIQTMRKDSGFDVVDHVKASIRGSEKLIKVVDKRKAEIAADVLADSIVCGVKLEGAATKQWDINGENVEIDIVRVKLS